MSFNSTTRDIDWPSRLVWSSELEVQLLLAELPLIAIGVLGAGTTMLMLVTRRIRPSVAAPYRAYRSKSVWMLAVSTFCAFTSGFFDILDLVQSEGLSVNYFGMQTLSVVAIVFASSFTSAYLLFLYHRTLDCLTDCNPSSEEREGSYFEDEISNVSDIYKRKVLSCLSRSWVRYFTYLYLAIQCALDISWRHLLLQKRSLDFVPVFIASNSLQTVFMVALTLILLDQMRVQRKHDRGSGLRYLPTLAGTVLALGVCIAGYPIQAFTTTPMGRLVTATQIYIWQLDVLISSFTGSHHSASSRSSDSTSRLSSEGSARAPTLPEKPPTWTMHQPVDASLSNERLGRAPISEAVSPAADSPAVHRSNVSLGPVIRRSSRPPSWMDSSPSLQASYTPPSSDLPYAKPAAEPKTFDLAGDAVASSLPDQVTRLPGPAQYSQSYTRPTRSSARLAGTIYGRIRPRRSERPASLSSVSTGSYNTRGIRLDSPIEVNPIFDNTVVHSPSSKLPPLPLGKARLSGLMEQAEDEEAASLHNAHHQAILAPDGEVQKRQSEASTRWSAKSSPGLPTSLFSRQSDLSLSRFPRPPSPSITSIKTSHLRELDNQRRLDNTPEYINSLPSDSSSSDSISLRPPRMPIIAQDAPNHQHSLSWQSNDTFTGSALGVSNSRGVNVTSFIDDSACPERPKDLPTTAEPVSEPVAKIMKASSVTRKSARLLLKTASLRKSRQSGEIADDKITNASLEILHFDRVGISLATSPQLTRNNSVTSSNQTSDTDLQGPFVYDGEMVPPAKPDYRRRDTTDEIIKGYYQA